MSLAGRLIVSYLMVILVALAVIGGTLIYLVQTYLVSSTEWQLTSQAQRVAQSVAPNLEEKSWEGLKLQLWTLSYSLDLDLWVLDSEGRTMAYAWQQGDEVPLDLVPEEVEAALTGGTLLKKAVGSEQQGVLVVVPVRGEERQVLGAVAVRSEAAGVSNTLWSIMQLLAYAVIPAGLLAGVLGYSLSRRILKPLQAMTEAARRMVPEDFQPAEAGPAGRAKEDEVQELARSFAYATAQVEAAIREQRRLEALRRRLVADISHEFRGPLTTLRAFIEMEREQELSPEEYQEGMELVHSEVLHLSRLVEDLMDLSLLEGGGADRLRPAWVEVVPAMRRAVAATKLLAEQAEVDLDLDESGLGQGGPEGTTDRRLLVRADPDRLQQVLRNLLENAIRHTPSGGKVRLEAAVGQDGIWFHVSDTGTGIPAEDLPLVWERFYKADKARPRTGSAGSGLGLAIVRRLVELHGGEVAARSKVGEGSRFSVRLPVVRRAPWHHAG